MKGCPDCESEERRCYEAQQASIRTNEYDRNIYRQQMEEYYNASSYLKPQNTSCLVYNEHKSDKICSICVQEKAICNFEQYITVTIFGKEFSPERLTFKNICETCKEYLEIATPKDMLILYEKLSKERNPLNRNKKYKESKPSLLKRIKKWLHK